MQVHVSNNRTVYISAKFVLSKQYLIINFSTILARRDLSDLPAN